ncbi:MAG: ABC transporter substrate-binding protein [Pseudomonadota bacterium]
MPADTTLGQSPRSAWGRRRRVTVLAALAVACAWLGACSEAPTESDLRIYRHALDNKVDNVDPARAATVYANHLVLNLFDTLYAYRYLARPYQLKPNLATAMPEVSDDGLTYTIRIREGVHFIDDPAFADGKGREVTAADVVYSIERQLDPDTNSQGDWLWRGRVDRLESVDRYTLRIHLSKRFPQLTHTLAQGFSAVMAREAVNYYGEQIGVHPVGSGPFTLESIDAQRAVLLANPTYREEPVHLDTEGYDETLHSAYGLEAIEGLAPPFIDRLEIWFIAEDQARWNSFRKGNEVHYARASRDAIEEAYRDGEIIDGRLLEYRALNTPAPEVIYHTFNFDFDEIGYHADPAREARNRLLRCALVNAYDWQARNEAYFDGTAEIFSGVLPPTVPEFDPTASLAYATRDSERAGEYLRQGDWHEDNLPEIVYGFNGTSTQQQYFEQFRAWVAEIGFPLSKVLPKRFGSFADFANAIRSGELMMSFKSWSLDYPDAENMLQAYYGPNRAPGSNDANYANDHYDALYELASTMEAGPQRTAIFREMNQMLMDDCAVIAGVARTQLLMWHDEVIYFPDRNIVGGFSLKYVSLGTPRPRAALGE